MKTVTNRGQHTPYVCRKCGSTEAYVGKPNHKGWSARRCKACTDRRVKEWETRHRDQKLTQLRTYQRSPAGKAYQRAYNAAIKAEVFAAYGDRCACCQEDEPLFLTVDHIDGSGAAHKASGEIGPSGSKLYRWLKRHGFPKDNFQLLCGNCNRGKYLNGGRCPHERTPLALVGNYRPE